MVPATAVWSQRIKQIVYLLKKHSNKVHPNCEDKEHAQELGDLSSLQTLKLPRQHRQHDVADERSLLEGSSGCYHTRPAMLMTETNVVERKKFVVLHRQSLFQLFSFHRKVQQISHRRSGKVTVWLHLRCIVIAQVSGGRHGHLQWSRARPSTKTRLPKGWGATLCQFLK